jgi:hypothetical protein
VNRSQSIREGVLDCCVEKFQHLRISEFGAGNERHGIVQQYAFASMSDGEYDVMVKDTSPVGFPSELRTMIPPSTLDGRSPISSRTRGDTQDACPSIRRSAMGRPLRRGSVVKSS